MLGQVGDITPQSKRIYVVRRTSLAPELESETPLEPPTESREIIVPPDDEEFFEGTLLTQVGDNSAAPPDEETPPSEAEAFEEVTGASWPNESAGCGIGAGNATSAVFRH